MSGVLSVTLVEAIAGFKQNAHFRIKDLENPTP
jgi:hypothetical protein